ncbi:hypothetical protein HPB50_006282 [Hyalomma asiaticum]|uniref:Uncharacterized protein n=1 Tax=Hyalomma asiaticum TaxID=266040 RepID=A0ACB7SQU8_HYAAI|nr:hypothetical protein HPB50_006282 [Hyalomma asiaticum]
MRAFIVALLCLVEATYAQRNFNDLLGLGFPCARDDDCFTGRGMSCQEWVCACAPSSPVKVQIQGIDTCLPAKSLYESCRFHEECSHRSANMRCIDFLCYCPLPFELRGNGDCLAPKPNWAKLIAAATPTSLLFIIAAGIGGAFIYRRLFPGDNKRTSTTTATRRPDQMFMTSSLSARSRVPSNSISVRSGPLKSLRPKKPNSSLPNNKTSAPSPSFLSTRLLRVPPDQLRPDAFSPGPTSTTTAMRTSSFSPPVPFAMSSQMLGRSSARSTAQPQPPRLSTTRLMNKLLSSSADSSDEDNIVVRVLGDCKPESKTSVPPQMTSLPFTATDLQEHEALPFRKGDGCRMDDGSSLPIEWGMSMTTSDQDRRNSLGVTTGGKQGVTKKTLGDGRNDDTSARTLFSSFRQSKNVTFLDEVSSVSIVGRSHLNEGNTSGQLTTKHSSIFVEHDLSMKTGSLKAETRWLWQSVRVPDTTADKTSSGCQQSRKSEPAWTEQVQASAEVKNDGTDNRAEYHRGRPLSRGERNRLGLGTPFVGSEEGPLAESASIPLSFLSSSSPSFEVLPKPDITSGMLREALLQSAGDDEPAPDPQEQQDASLVADFIAAIVQGGSSSDGTAASSSLPPHSDAPVARHVEDVPANAANEEVEGAPVATAQRAPSPDQKVVQLPRISPPSDGGQPALPAAVEEAPTGLPKPAVETAAPEAASGADQCKAPAAEELPPEALNNSDKAGQSEDCSSSSADIEHLAEILNRLKITQLGNEHHRRERTLHREYDLVAPFLPGLATGPRWPKAAVPVAAAFPAVERVVGLGATRPTTVEMAVALAEPRARTPPRPPSPQVQPAPKASPALPPLRESNEYSTESESSQDDRADLEDAALPSATTTATEEPLVRRRHLSPAQLHKARTASSHLVPPAAPSSRRPVPLKRDTASVLVQVIAEVFHGAQLLSPTPLVRKTPVLGEGEALGRVSPGKAVDLSPLALEGHAEKPLDRKNPPEPKARTYRDAKNGIPAIEVAVALDSTADTQDVSPTTQPHVRAGNVRSEPLRARSPFAMRKHFSEPFHTRESAAAANKVSNRDEELSLCSHFRSSDFGSLDTRSSSAAGCGGAATEQGTYDTDALMPSSIPTLTVTSDQDGEVLCDDPTLPSSLCHSHSRHCIPTYALMPPADSSLDAAGSTSETNVHLSVETTDIPSQPEISHKAAEVTASPPVVPRFQRRTEAVKEAMGVGDRACPKELTTRKLRANQLSNDTVPSRPTPLPRRIKDILSSNISSVLRTTRDNTTVTECATFAETPTFGTTSPRISPSTFFPVSPTATLSSGKVHASVTTYGTRHRDTPVSPDCNDQATTAATVCTSAVAEVSSSASKSRPDKRREKKETRKKISLPHFFLGRHRDSESGDDASSVRSESSVTTDGLRLSAIMAKLGILPSHRLFSPSSSTTTTADTGGSSRGTVLPSRHGAGDRGGHFGNGADGASPQRPAFAAERGGVPSSVMLPRVWPEPSTSFSVVETSDTESIIVDDSCADALSYERDVLRRERREDPKRRNASPVRGVAYDTAASPDPEWYSCSSRMSDRSPPVRTRARKAMD